MDSERTNIWHDEGRMGRLEERLFSINDTLTRLSERERLTSRDLQKLSDAVAAFGDLVQEVRQGQVEIRQAQLEHYQALKERMDAEDIRAAERWRMLKWAGLLFSAVWTGLGWIMAKFGPVIVAALGGASGGSSRP